jgi:hypothetical protein
LSNERRHLTHAFGCPELSFEPSHYRIGSLQSRTGWHPDVDDELVSLVHWEEAIGHRGHQK